MKPQALNGYGLLGSYDHEKTDMSAVVYARLGGRENRGWEGGGGEREREREREV